MESVLQLLAPLPSPTGNLALDFALTLLLVVVVGPIVYKWICFLRDTSHKRVELSNLRKTLEMKNKDVTALRQALLNMRNDIDMHRHRKEEDDCERLRIAQMAQQREVDPEHVELEEQLLQASLRSSERFDA